MSFSLFLSLRSLLSYSGHIKPWPAAIAMNLALQIFSIIMVICKRIYSNFNWIRQLFHLMA